MLASIVIPHLDDEKESLPEAASNCANMLQTLLHKALLPEDADYTVAIAESFPDHAEAPQLLYSGTMHAASILRSLVRTAIPTVSIGPNWYKTMQCFFKDDRAFKTMAKQV